jgi:hypothetical protein
MAETELYSLHKPALLTLLPILEKQLRPNPTRLSCIIVPSVLILPQHLFLTSLYHFYCICPFSLIKQLFEGRELFYLSES